jgi:hypothetical protein
VIRRAAAAALLLLTLSFGGCAALDPPPSQPCTLFGCTKPANIVREVGGMVLVMGVLGIALTIVVRRMSD